MTKDRGPLLNPPTPSVCLTAAGNCSCTNCPPKDTLNEQESNEVIGAYESGDPKRIAAVKAKYYPEIPSRPKEER